MYARLASHPQEPPRRRKTMRMDSSELLTTTFASEGGVSDV